MASAAEFGCRPRSCPDRLPAPVVAVMMPASDDNATMPDPTADDVRAFIAAGIACEHLAVEGDGRHFFATIVSPAFEDLPLVRRHQQVYAALGDRMREQIHALSMKTLTPAEWAAENQRPQTHHH
jgi:acid stress-induced BolA-like protein IbaG/YrbA